ncbi:PhzF family phenazine biosynthesis protein [Halopenitus sp. H-Gu1]|uniref:PhzF family phenazine biosynthesis protein n=1 Tax=Halopenitus sp. H-Gu1 TaxID=3242697 RepID=UPI00359D8063
METRRMLLVDAFTTDPLAGNVAGVVPNADGLSEDRMRAIAAEIGASETAFVREVAESKSDPGPESESESETPTADIRIQYFTPSREVDLCGHATIATFAHLFDDGVLEAGTHVLATNVGPIDVEIESNGIIRLCRPVETVEPVDIDYETLGEALGILPAAFADVGADLPVARASIGLPFLLVPVNFLERLGEGDPDPEAVESLSERFDVAGIYAFTFDTLEADSTIHARAWAPALGVHEDPVTGTASGAAGAYLRNQDVFDGDHPDEVCIEQGHFVDRPGRVRVRVDGDRVFVGGRAVTALDGELAVPEPDADEILET